MDESQQVLNDEIGVDEVDVQSGQHVEEEEVEGEGEDEEQAKPFKEKKNEIPFKVKKTIFNLFGLLQKKKNRKTFKNQLEHELKSHIKLYSKSYGVALVGTERLVEAGREYITCLDVSIQATKQAISRVKKLRKYNSKITEMEERTNKLKKFFEEKVEESEEEEEEIDSEDMLFMFTEIHQIKDNLESLLMEISKFKKGMKIRRKILHGLITGSVSSSIFCFGSGWAVSGAATGCICATLFTSGISFPVALTLYSLGGIGILTGAGITTLSFAGCAILLGAGAIETLSYGHSLSKVKKIKKKVLKLKRGKQKKLWNDIMDTMEKIKNKKIHHRSNEEEEEEEEEIVE